MSSNQRVSDERIAELLRAYEFIYATDPCDLLLILRELAERRRSDDSSLRRQHIPFEDCWCHPTLNYTDPDTGNQHWIHHEPN